MGWKRLPVSTFESVHVFVSIRGELRWEAGYNCTEKPSAMFAITRKGKRYWACDMLMFALDFTWRAFIGWQLRNQLDDRGAQGPSWQLIQVGAPCNLMLLQGNPSFYTMHIVAFWPAIPTNFIRRCVSFRFCSTSDTFHEHMFNLLIA